MPCFRCRYGYLQGILDVIKITVKLNVASINKNTGRALIISACIVLVAVYAIFDPSAGLFPRCPFLVLTGLDCPGCGSQRAIHSIFRGNIGAAFHYNTLLVVMIPYIAVCVWLEYLGGKKRYPRLRRILMGREACYILLGIFLLFFILRNFAF